MTMGLMCGYLAASWNPIGGYAGQMSLGHALFFAIGSYSVALLARMPDVPLVAAFPLAILVSVGLAWIIATICFRYALRGIYFAVGTLLLAEIARILVINSDVLGRSQGLQIPGMQGALNFSFGPTCPFLHLPGHIHCPGAGQPGAGALQAGLRPRGPARAGRRGAGIGVDVAAIKRLAFVLSAALTCVGGVIYAGLVRYVEPGYDLSLSITLFMVMGAVLGGRGTALGPFLGGVVMVIVQETLITVGSAFGTTSVSALAQMIYGLFFVVILLVFPRGIVGPLLHRRVDRKATRFPPAPTPEAS